MTTMVTVQTPFSTFTVPMAAAGHGQTIAIDEHMLTQLLHSNGALREAVMIALDDAAEADGSSIGAPSMSIEEMARHIPQRPHLTETVMRWLHSSPEARLQLAHLQGNPFVGSNAPDSPVFRAAREGDCGVLEQLLGPNANREFFEREFSASGDSLLHVVAWHGHARVASMLVARGHCVQLSSRNRSTALHSQRTEGILTL
jgi:hypothetical protein